MKEINQKQNTLYPHTLYNYFNVLKAYLRKYQSQVCFILFSFQMVGGKESH